MHTGDTTAHGKAGGDVLLVAGSGTSTSPVTGGRGGAVALTGGDADGRDASDHAGDVTLRGGAAFAGAGGDVKITSGKSHLGTSGDVRVMISTGASATGPITMAAGAAGSAPTCPLNGCHVGCWRRGRHRAPHRRGGH